MDMKQKEIIRLRAIVRGYEDGFAPISSLLKESITNNNKERQQAILDVLSLFQLEWNGHSVVYNLK